MMYMIDVMLFYIQGFSVFLFFFFQAEDGIRDLYVTGVQTCALPISIEFTPPADGDDGVVAVRRRREFDCRCHCIRVAAADDRSEERRVGKECRCRWAADQ